MTVTDTNVEVRKSNVGAICSDNSDNFLTIPLYNWSKLGESLMIVENSRA